MQLQVLHERGIVDYEFPFRMLVSGIKEFPPHWHEEVEIVYVVEGKVDIGINQEIHTLLSRDILLIGPGEVHHFLQNPQKRKLIILQFGRGVFDQNDSIFHDRCFPAPRIPSGCTQDGMRHAHEKLEAYILQILEEYNKKLEGYRLALRARICDMMVLLLREIPWERYSAAEKNKRLVRLERLQSVFKYVDEHYAQDIPLEEAAKVSGFSVYHFTRFFKESIGMTFGDFLSRYRIAKAEVLLKNTEHSITEIAFSLGFNSIKTFNRVFKTLKGCSPSSYRKSNI